MVVSKAGQRVGKWDVVKAVEKDPRLVDRWVVWLVGVSVETWAVSTDVLRADQKVGNLAAWTAVEMDPSWVDWSVACWV